MDLPRKSCLERQLRKGIGWGQAMWGKLLNNSTRMLQSYTDWMDLAITFERGRERSGRPRRKVILCVVRRTNPRTSREEFLIGRG